MTKSLQLLPESHDGPTTGWLAHWFGRLWIWLTGWKIVGSIPAGSKFVLVAAPHTSNWDLIYMLAATGIFRLKVSWVGKHTIFRAPFAPLMRKLGGIPVNRSSPQGLVNQIADLYKSHDKLVIAIPPSGTRKKMKYWKSGFYWIAKTAEVPILCGFLDYHKKEAGFGISFIPTGKIAEDMDRIREFYKGIRGKNHDILQNFKLKEEDTDAVGRRTESKNN